MYQSFDEECQSILLKTVQEKEALKDEFIGSEHLMLAILKSENTISSLLNQMGITYHNYKQKLRELVGKQSSKKTWNLYTPFLKQVIVSAILKSKENHTPVTLPTLFQSLLEAGDGLGLRTLSAMDVDLSAFTQLFHDTTKKEALPKKHLMLDSFGRNLITDAPTFDTVIGRENELNLLIKTLCKRKKSNPILLGEAGVGKTALVEELARRISQKRVPTELQNKKIYSLETSTLVAGTKYRGEFEERFGQLLKEVEEDPDIILFIDEIHTLIGAGGAEGAIDASNILKPALARGKIKLIGATTIQEFNHYISKDKAFSRRFELIYVLEPKEEVLRDILTSSAKQYEEYHNVRLEESTITKIMELSNQLNNDSHQPDKALDLLDEICTSKHLLFERTLVGLTESIQKVSEKKNENVCQGNFREALLWRNKECKLREDLEKRKMNTPENAITAEDVTIYFDEKYRSKPMSSSALKKKLESDSVHKENQIAKLIEAIPKASSFLFYGPEGTGKNYLAEKWIKISYPNRAFTVDMSEYQHDHDINKLLGAPLGYSGCEEETPFLSFLKSNPYGLIYIKNIHLASKKILTTFVDILKSKKVHDNRGRVLNATQKFLFTVSVQKKNLGFVEFSSDKELTKQISQLLLDQVDVMIPFETMSSKEQMKIIRQANKNINPKQLKEIETHLKLGKITLSEALKKVKKRQLLESPS